MYCKMIYFYLSKVENNDKHVSINSYRFLKFLITHRIIQIKYNINTIVFKIEYTFKLKQNIFSFVTLLTGY